MKNYPTTKGKGIATAVSVLAWLSLQPMLSTADERIGYDRQIKYIQGVTVTGVNSVRGEPFFDWGDQFGGVFNFPTMGVYDPLGSVPLTLDLNTPDSAVLATIVDPIYLMIAGKPADYEVNPEWINVPLRKVPVVTDFAFIETEPLPDIREAQPLELSQADPADMITLGQWMQANGVVKINCSDGGADITLRMRDLIPNRMYSVWATMGLRAQPGSTPGVVPIPLGGAPNMFMTNENGDAKFERWIKFCPLDSESIGMPMLNIDVYYHANHQNYGAIIAPGFIDGNWPGVITFSHVIFPVSVDLLGD